MEHYIHMSLATYLAIALGWSTLFSFSQGDIRGYRYLGIMACYVMPVIFLFVAGLKLTFFTWCAFGVAGSLLYFLWELIERFTIPAGEERPPIQFVTLVHGLFAWPIMVPEAVEYFLATIGVLPAARFGDTDTGEYHDISLVTLHLL